MNNNFDSLKTKTLFQRGIKVPLSKKGKKVMRSMKKEYGAKKGKQVFYASYNKGTIKGVKAY